jgi:hypothetical protein
MAGFLSNIGGMLGGKFGSMAAKEIAAGMVKSYSGNWTIEGFREAAENNYKLDRLLQVSPKWSETLANAFKNHEALRDVTANELLSWIQQGNPALFRQISQEAAVVAWIFKAWEAGKVELAQGKVDT